MDEGDHTPRADGGIDPNDGDEPDRSGDSDGSQSDRSPSESTASDSGSSTPDPGDFDIGDSDGDGSGVGDNGLDPGTVGTDDGRTVGPSVGDDSLDDDSLDDGSLDNDDIDNGSLDNGGRDRSSPDVDFDGVVLDDEDDNQGLFDDLLSGEPIFENKEVLRPSYTPHELPHRNDQINRMATILVSALRGETPSNILIYGKTGTGKTASAKFVSQELESTSQKYDVPCEVDSSSWETYFALAVFPVPVFP